MEGRAALPLPSLEPLPLAQWIAWHRGRQQALVVLFLLAPADRRLVLGEGINPCLPDLLV